MPLTEERLLESIKSGSLFGYVQCDIEVPEILREAFANFPTIFNNNNVGTDEIGHFMEEYANKKGLLTQRRRILTWSYFLENRTIITALLLFYLDLGLVYKRNYRFVQYTPIKCFNSFAQSAVNARRDGDENPSSSVVAKTKRLLANSFHGYQIIYQSRHTVTKYLSDDTTYGATNNKLFKLLGFINDRLYELEMAKSELEHKEPTKLRIFILQNAKLRILELYYNFFDKNWDVTKFES